MPARAQMSGSRIPVTAASAIRRARVVARPIPRWIAGAKPVAVS